MKIMIIIFVVLSIILSLAVKNFEDSIKSNVWDYIDNKESRDKTFGVLFILKWLFIIMSVICLLVYIL